MVFIAVANLLMTVTTKMNLFIIHILIVTNIFVLVNCHLCMLLNDTNTNELWDEYKKKYEKNYKGCIETRRKAIWLQNCEKVRKHNEDAKKGHYNFTLSANRLADMTLRRYHSKMIKLAKSPRRDIQNTEEVGAAHINFENIPEEVDWRENGFKTLPYNQKECGSCYAFSITHSIQAQIYKHTNISEPLSEQQIVDCSLRNGNHGCGGGSLRNTLKYIEATGGLMAARDYPYIAKQTRCRFDKRKILVNVTQWAILPPRDEITMQAIVANVGPVAASINASPHTFQLYKSGVYDDPACSSNVVNHAMLIIGYTKDAWILKNWWGDKWGEDGYMRLKRNSNHCGIANYVAYVTV